MVVTCKRKQKSSQWAFSHLRMLSIIEKVGGLRVSLDGLEFTSTQTG